MPALLAPGLLSLVASAGLTLSYQAGVRSEARAQQARPAVGENSTIGVAEVEPSIGLIGWSPSLWLELAYAPRYTHQGGDAPDSDVWLQRAWARVGWRPVARWRLEAEATATAGTVDLFRVATSPGRPGDPPPVGQAAPVASFVDYRRLALTMAANGRLGGRLQLLCGLALLQEGGADAAQRETLPLQRSALASGELAWRLSGRTTLSGTLTGSVTHYFDVAVTNAEPGAPTQQSWSNWIGRASVAWNRRLTTQTSVWARAGLALLDTNAPGTNVGPTQWSAVVGLNRDSGTSWPHFSGGALVAVAPTEDRLTGALAQRAELRGWGAWSPARRVSLGGSAMTARVLYGPSAKDAFAAGEGWVNWSAAKALFLGAGGRWTTQWTPPQASGRAAGSDSVWTVYVSVQVASYDRARPAYAPVQWPGR